MGAPSGGGRRARLREIHDSRDGSTSGELDDGFEIASLLLPVRRALKALELRPMRPHRRQPAGGVLQHALGSILGFDEAKARRLQQTLVPPRSNELRVTMDAALAYVFVGDRAGDHSSIRKEKPPSVAEQPRDLQEQLQAVPQMQNHIQGHRRIERGAREPATIARPTRAPAIAWRRTLVAPRWHHSWGCATRGAVLQSGPLSLHLRRPALDFVLHIADDSRGHCAGPEKVVAANSQAVARG